MGIKLTIGGLESRSAESLFVASGLSTAPYSQTLAVHLLLLLFVGRLMV